MTVKLLTKQHFVKIPVYRFVVYFFISFHANGDFCLSADIIINLCNQIGPRSGPTERLSPDV